MGMALFRKFFVKKTPDRLLEISDRVYVFACCFSADSMGVDEYRELLSGIAEQLQEFFPDASFLVSNFWSRDRGSRISDIWNEYGMTVMDYQQHYQGCPVLPLEVIHHFLISCENWLSLDGQHNMLLMHCERGGWPVLAFMLAGLHLYRKTYAGEQEALEMVYKQLRRDFIQHFFPLNPQPSHLRYLHYITRQGSGSEWPHFNRPLILDSVVLHIVPWFDAEGGCRPYLRVHGQDPSPGNKSAKVLFEMPKTKEHLLRYGQAEAPIRIRAFCRVQGDVVLECIHIGDNIEHEETMFRVMFSTASIQSNILLLNRDDIDVSWNVNNQFPRDFRAEILFSDLDSFKPAVTAVEVAHDGDETDVASVDAGYEAEKEWLDNYVAQMSYEAGNATQREEQPSPKKSYASRKKELADDGDETVVASVDTGDDFSKVEKDVLNYHAQILYKAGNAAQTKEQPSPNKSYASPKEESYATSVHRPSSISKPMHGGAPMSSGAQKQTFAPPPPPPPRSGIGRNNMVTPLRPPPPLPPSRYYGEVTDRNQASAQDRPEENSNAALSGTAIGAVITKGQLNPPNSEEQSRFSSWKKTPAMDGEPSTHDHLEVVSQDQSAEPCDLRLQYLIDITDNFSQELGRGGFGVVYKNFKQGTLPNGAMIAVKNLVSMIQFPDKQFKNEVDSLMRVRHQNIVRFVGYCYETWMKYI